MIRTIDHYNGIALQKITTSEGKLRHFQLIPEDKIGDGTASRQFPTLSAARTAGGWPMSTVVATTKPKMAYPQNNKGYRADRR